MCDESYSGQQAAERASAANTYNSAKDIGLGQKLAEHRLPLRMQLERRLHQSREQTTQVADALQLLTPEVETMINALRVLNRLGMLQL